VTITQIRVSRTYNTLHYTSQRFELEADLEEGEEPDHAVIRLALQLHGYALAAMRAGGIREIEEPGGRLGLFPRDSTARGDDDEIPF